MDFQANPDTFKKLTKLEKDIFDLRLKQHLPDAIFALEKVYPDRDDLDQWIQNYVDLLAHAYAARPHDLRLLDLRRVQKHDWFQRSDQIGYICYADRFAGSLRGVIDKIPYLKELGVTYLHIMPMLQPREEPNDGGYAVQDYREIADYLGNMNDLTALTKALRENNISLCTDIVCNHTAQEHEWAQKALAGEKKYQDYYFIFPDRTMPDQYEKNLREIFPASDPGNFRHYPELKIGEQDGGWVWTTFHDYQWDLNYQNPAVLGEMLDIILNLANHGVEVFRMDAVAFMWKRMGTNCENMPEAHALLQAFRTLTNIACPGIIFKAEAIVAPEDVVPYFGLGRMAGKECEIAYHNSLMVLLWSMLAEQDAVLATHSLQKMPEIPERAAWVNYVRCHDDIGWAITDENAAAVGLNGYWHRSFLSDFYAGEYPTSYARGAVFQYNPENGDRRISGAGASLAGLEKGLEENDEHGIDMAIKRLLLIHNVIFMSGGIPLIYMGDEIGMTNDYSYTDEALHADDNRWLQRPLMDWDRAFQRHDPNSIPGRLFHGIKNLVETRQRCFMLHAEAHTEPEWMHNDKLFGLVRRSPRGRLMLVANITPDPQTATSQRLSELNFSGRLKDELTGRIYEAGHDLNLAPYEAVWLTTN